MKIVITGSLGHISRPLTTQLLEAGHQVTVISSSESKRAEIEAIGASAAIGSVEDVAFLTNSFKGADVVYTMVPQSPKSNDYKAFIKTIAQNYADALKGAGVTKVVHLSSIGAHLPENAGPISGMHHAENILNNLDGIIVKTLRPASFYYNFYHLIGLIKNAGIVGGNYPETTTQVIVHTDDIADAAYEEITTPFTKNSICYIASDEKTGTEVAQILGNAIGKPDLKWVEFTDEQSTAGALQGGYLSENVAANLTEMGAALRRGDIATDYNKHKPTLSKRKLVDFAKNEFAAAYNA